MTAGLIALLAVPAVCFGQAGRIKTVGQAEVMVPPDTVEVSFSVRAQEQTLAAARDKAATQMSRVLEAIRGLRIPGIDIGTSQLSVTPVIRRPQGQQQYPGPDAEFRQEIIGYQVTNSATVRITGEGEDLGRQVSRLMDTATTSGATSFSGPSFYRKETAAARQQALTQATQDAIAQAKALAAAAGVAIKGYSYIGMFPEDEPQPPMPMMEPRMMTMAMDRGGGPPTPVEVRDITIHMQVWVTATY